MHINYQALMDAALLNHVVRPVLQQLANSPHAFNEIYLTFLVQQTQMSQKLRTLQQNHMSILLCQNTFSALKVDDNEITVTMVFATGQETVVIPFTALTQFIDKTHEFALEFHPQQHKPTPQDDSVQNDNVISFRELQERE